jgi:hypothetical protein
MKTDRYVHRMTEAEWHTSLDSYRMVHRCRCVIRSYPRKGHLFAVACCRRIWHLLPDERSRAAVEAAEAYAEGRASADQLRAAEKAAAAARDAAFRIKGKVGASAEWAAQFAASSNAWHAAKAASNFAYVAAGDGLQPGPEHAAQAHLLRCIFGPLPLRTVTIEPSWLSWSDSMVVRPAHAIYDSQAFDNLPARGAVLSDAGCRDGDLLGHCGSPWPHVRGCWVVDLLLDKQ